MTISAPTSIGTLLFKGERSYLHGTDILEATRATIRKENPHTRIENIEIVFHSISFNQLLLTSTPPCEITPKAKFTCNIDSTKKIFFLLESGEKVYARYPYDEDAITSTAVINKDLINVVSPNTVPAKNIERWIALTKLLHLSIFPNLDGKWLFARGKFQDIEVFDQIAHTHEIRLEANFNTKLTRNAVFVDAKKIGEIYFALG